MCLTAPMTAEIGGWLSLQLLHTKRCRTDLTQRVCGWGGTGEELSVALVWM